MPAILIADALSQEGRDVFTRYEGFTVDYKPDITPEDLKKCIGEYDGCVIRSRTRITADTLENPGRLKVVGRAGVGLDNVDIPEATAKGIIVMNTPGGNTVSTAENAFSLLLCLARQVARADASMKAGRWDKKSIKGVELLNKVIGVIGLGRIGMEVVKRAKGFEMRVLGYDPYVAKDVAAKAGVEVCDLETIWSQADFITFHTPVNDDTRQMLNAAVIEKLKPGCRIINCARGGLIDEDALVAALQSGRIAGAALDVFSTEPLAEDHPLRSLENVVLTPHLSASTTEAQEKVAVDVAEQIVETLQGKPPRNAVNAPAIDPELLEAARPYLSMAEKLGHFLAQYVDGPLSRLTVKYCGAVLDHPTDAITTAAVIGFLSHQIGQGELNYINAPFLLKKRGVELVESRSSELYEYANLMTLEGRVNGRVVSVSGTLFTPHTPRVVILNDRHFDAWMDGTLIVIENRDVPGVIGAVGTYLGSRNVNIAQMTWGRSTAGGDAITILNVDQEVTPDLLEGLAKVDNVQAVRLIRL